MATLLNTKTNRFHTRNLSKKFIENPSIYKIIGDYVFNADTKRFVKKSTYVKQNGELRKKYTDKEVNNGVLYQSDNTTLMLNSREMVKKQIQKIYSTLKDKSKPKSWKFLPITVKTKSLIMGFEQSHNFANWYHYKNWLEKIHSSESGTTSDGKPYSVDYRNEDVFSIVSLKVIQNKGGCNKTSETTNKKSKGLDYIFSLVSPPSQNDNCGLACLKYLFDLDVSYHNIRKTMQFGKGQLAPEQITAVMKEYIKEKQLTIIIDKDTDEELTPITDDSKYMFLDTNNNHYYVIEKIEKVNHKKINKKEGGNRGQMYWDIETRKSEETIMISGQKSALLTDTLLCAYYQSYQSNIWNKVHFIADDTQTSCRKFLDFLIDEHNKKHRYRCIAHNGSRFDVYFLMKAMTPEELSKCKISLRGTSVISLTFLGNTFKDSCCFLTASLDSLCKDFKVSVVKQKEFNLHGKTVSNEELCFYRPELKVSEFLQLEQTDPEFWNLYVEYCYKDCISLSQIWISFVKNTTALIEKIGKHLVRSCSVQDSSTIGGLAKKVFVKSCQTYDPHSKKVYFKQAMREVMKFMNTKEKYDFISNFKRGGISHCNQKGLHHNGTMSIDLTSQYPASGVNMIVPSGESREVDEFKEEYYGYYKFTNVRFETEYKFKPVALYVKGKSLDWSADYMQELYIDSELAKYVMQHYGMTYESVKGLISTEYVNGCEIFGNYFFTMFSAKKLEDEFKDSKDTVINAKYNPAFREVVKLFMNSLTGKLVENTTKYFSVKFTGEDSEQKKMNINGQGVAMKPRNEDDYNFLLPLGCMIYSYSKRLLFEYIHCLPNKNNDVIHVETDSIYYAKKHDAVFKQNIAKYDNRQKYPVIMGNELGNAKKEKDTMEDSYFLGKKFYYVYDKCKAGCKIECTCNYRIKGIPIKTINEDGSTKILVNKSLYQEVYEHKKDDAPITRTFTTLKRNLWSNTVIASYEMSRTISSSHDYKEYF